MRVIYPLAYATIRWPVKHESRTFAAQDLHAAAPELFYHEDDEEGILRVPLGLQGVLSVANELGFLPNWTGPVANIISETLF